MNAIIENINNELIVKDENELTFLGKIDNLQFFLLVMYYRNIPDNQISDYFNKYFNITGEKSTHYRNFIYEKFRFIIDRYDDLKIDINDLEFKFKKIYLDKVRNFTPNKIVISLTNKCMYDCKYCYAHNNRINKTLSFSDIKSIIDYCKYIGVKSIDFTGGDPLMRSDFFQILDYLEENNIKVNFSTKIILNQCDVVKLCNYQCIESFQYSLDSLYQDEQIMLVPNLSVKKSLKFIESISKSKKHFKFKVNSVITQFNINRILDLSDKLFDLKVDNHGLSPYTFSFGINNDEYFATKEQYMKLSNEIKKYKYKNKLIYPITLTEEYSIDNEILCNAGVDGLVINYDGEVYVCERMCGFKELSVGNIYLTSIAEIWNGDKIKKFSNPDTEFFKNSKCYTCENLYECKDKRGICYVHSKILNGEIYSPDNYCIYKYNKYNRRLF